MNWGNPLKMLWLSTPQNVATIKQHLKNMLKLSTQKICQNQGTPKKYALNKNHF